jgi:hypothetical protein
MRRREAELRRRRERLLVAFVELRARLGAAPADDFAGGEDERARALERTRMRGLVAGVAARLPGD